MAVAAAVVDAAVVDSVVDAAVVDAAVVDSVVDAASAVVDSVVDVAAAVVDSVVDAAAAAAAAVGEMMWNLVSHFYYYWADLPPQILHQVSWHPWVHPLPMGGSPRL